MQKLEVKCIQTGSGLQTMKVSGLTDEELYALKRIPNAQAREQLLDMLDERNNKTGTCWKCGYGVYGLWFDNEAAYFNIGTSCE